MKTFSFHGFRLQKGLKCGAFANGFRKTPGNCPDIPADSQNKITEKESIHPINTDRSRTNAFSVRRD